MSFFKLDNVSLDTSARSLGISQLDGIRVWPCARSPGALWSSVALTPVVPRGSDCQGVARERERTNGRLWSSACARGHAEALQVCVRTLDQFHVVLRPTDFLNGPWELVGGRSTCDLLETWKQIKSNHPPRLVGQYAVSSSDPIGCQSCPPRPTPPKPTLHRWICQHRELGT